MINLLVAFLVAGTVVAFVWLVSRSSRARDRTASLVGLSALLAVIAVTLSLLATASFEKNEVYYVHAEVLNVMEGGESVCLRFARFSNPLIQFATRMTQDMCFRPIETVDLTDVARGSQISAGWTFFDTPSGGSTVILSIDMRSQR